MGDDEPDAATCPKNNTRPVARAGVAEQKGFPNGNQTGCTLVACMPLGPFSAS